MNIGRMKTRVTLQSKSVTRDELGGEVVTWVDEFTAWAEAKPLRGRDFFAAMQAQSDASVEFRLRYRFGVQSTWRILWQGRQYDIVGDPPYQGSAPGEMVLLAKTAQS